MNSNDERSDNGTPLRLDDDGTVLNPRIVARVARLLRWYPREWRERFGDEFDAVLSSALRDGKGSLRLSIDVAREGIVARRENLGWVGKSAPPLERARASVMTIFLSMLGFLASAAALAFYEKGWQRAPALERINRANQIFVHSKANHLFDQLMTSPTAHRLQLATQHSRSGYSKAWKAYESFEARALNALHGSPAGRDFQNAVNHAHFASGVPVILNDVAHGAILLAIVLMVSALTYAVVIAARLRLRADRKRLVVPLVLLNASAIVFVICIISYQAFQNIPLGQPGSDWQMVRWMASGDFRFWPVVIFPLCVVVSIVLAAVGGVKLMRRVDFPTQVIRRQVSLAVLSAGCLGVALISTLSWVVALSDQAPNFLTAKDGGVFGTSFLTVFLVAIVVMIGTAWLVVTRSARCLRSIRTI